MTTLYQYSHSLAVNNGCYDGQLSIAELKKYGNSGLGTFNALDGELVVVDNEFFHCSAGHVRLATDEELLPWAAVSQFEQEHSITGKRITSMEDLQSILFEHLPSKNYPIALRILATAETISLGSVPKQSKPYKTIAEIIDNSILIEIGAMEVDLSGFFAPGFMYPMKSEGIHLHCLNKERTLGGHVLALNLSAATIHWQQLNAIQLILPQNREYQNVDLRIQSTVPLSKFEDKLKDH